MTSFKCKLVFVSCVRYNSEEQGHAYLSEVKLIVHLY